MDLRLSSLKANLSPSDSASDPEEKEISDDDDDDRNHKHRRRDTQSQPSDKDPLQQVLSRPYVKRNKPFGNGHPYKEVNSQSNETWRNYNMSPLEKEFSGRYDRKRAGLAPISRSPFDLNQRMRLNQSLSGDPGSGRGRGREPGSWSQRDPRFSSTDTSPHISQQGSVPSSMFAGRGMPPVPNAQNAAWNAFGLVPGLPNGGMDTLHSIGLQRTFRPPINPSMNVGVPRQRCRDFEERGFCLRGDMCPMEHGLNRIVVEDVQSLSQFNLPVSLPSAHLLGASAGPGSLSAIAPSSIAANTKGLYSKGSKSGVGEDGLGSDGAFSDSAVAGGADLYDPDQPLWTNDCSQTSTDPVVPNPAKIAEHQSLLDADPSDDQQIGLYDGCDSERPVGTSGILGSQSTSLPLQGRVHGSKSKSETRETINSKINSSIYVGNTTKDDQGVLNTTQGSAAHQGKWSNTARNIRKPSQKAQRTLFVDNIPQKNNQKDALLSHFCKFGEVIDIYIPMNSERAFVQFSKREEAEDALKAPDAVMGNRFIKLWWANRDNIPDEGIISGNGVPIASPLVAVNSTVAYPATTNRGKDALQSTAPKGSITQASVSPAFSSDHLRPVVTNGQYPSQKKIETLEFLREEVRKKQEMLDQKRQDFKRKLDKLEKQATGLKGEVASEQADKRQNVGTLADAAKSATQASVDPRIVTSPSAEMMTGRSRSGEDATQSPKSCKLVALQEPSGLKQSIRPLAPAGAPFIMNRFKLDNRPTSFKIVPPLPAALANVAALKEHFSVYGELSSVDLEDLELQAGSDELVTSKASALICFTTRHSAERAFSEGKCWKGQNMEFIWLTPSKSIKDNGGRENPSLSSSKGSSDAICQAAEEVASAVSHKAVVMPGDVKSDLSGRRDDGAEPMVPDEDCSSTPVSSKNL